MRRHKKTWAIPAAPTLTAFLCNVPTRALFSLHGPFFIRGSNPGFVGSKLLRPTSFYSSRCSFSLASHHEWCPKLVARPSPYPQWKVPLGHRSPIPCLLLFRIAGRWSSDMHRTGITHHRTGIRQPWDKTKTLNAQYQDIHWARNRNIRQETTSTRRG